MERPYALSSVQTSRWPDLHARTPLLSSSGPDPKTHRTRWSNHPRVEHGQLVRRGIMHS
jgi:hypothetical protein